MTKSHGVLPSLKRRKRRAGSRGPLRISLDFRRLALGVGTVLVLSLLMSIHFLPDRVPLRLGDRSPVDVRAVRSVVYTDTEATQLRARDAAMRVQNRYDADRGAAAQAAQAVLDSYEKVRQARDMGGSAVRRAEAIVSDVRGALGVADARYLLTCPERDLVRVEDATRRLVDAAMAKEIRSNTDDLAHVRDEIAVQARAVAANPGEAGILRAVACAAIRPTQLYNAFKTEQLREYAMQGTRPVQGQIRAGDLIISQGELVTQAHLDKFSALGLISPRIDVPTAVSIVALAVLMVGLVGYYLRRSYPRVYASPKLLFLLAATVITSVFGLKLFGTMLDIPFSGLQVGYLGMTAVVAAGMLIAVLLNAPIAMLVTALLSVQSGLVMNHELRFTVMTLMSSLVGIYAAAQIRNRTHLLFATVAIGGTNLGLVWLLGGLLGDTTREMVVSSAWALLSGALAIPIFWFGVAVLEKPFGILTHVWLLELSSSDHPLLRQLCLTAPGTYAHCIMVGNLAEAGAEAIGADRLFCRVASYYHDVGKMRKPHCFIENQSGDNIHNRLNPTLSALIIASHVRDGIELADEYKLPRQIRDVIGEHHGTSLIAYFYRQAILASCQGEIRTDPVFEQQFRYDGPRPQSRESGIIMLADTVEAAARCLTKPTVARIQGLVEAQVRDKLQDGQLDDCDLTLKDIQRIQAAFVRVLSAMHHGRIDYPELPKTDAAGAPATNGQPTAHASHYPELAAPARADAAVVAGRPDSPAT